MTDRARFAPGVPERKVGLTALGSWVTCQGCRRCSASRSRSGSSPSRTRASRRSSGRRRRRVPRPTPSRHGSRRCAGQASGGRRSRPTRGCGPDRAGATISSSRCVPRTGEAHVGRGPPTARCSPTRLRSSWRASSSRSRSLDDASPRPILPEGPTDRPELPRRSSPRPRLASRPWPLRAALDLLHWPRSPPRSRNPSACGWGASWVERRCRGWIWARPSRSVGVGGG